MNTTPDTQQLHREQVSMMRRQIQLAKMMQHKTALGLLALDVNTLTPRDVIWLMEAGTRMEWDALDRASQIVIPDGNTSVVLDLSDTVMAAVAFLDDMDRRNQPSLELSTQPPTIGNEARTKVNTWQSSTRRVAQNHLRGSIPPHQRIPLDIDSVLQHLEPIDVASLSSA